MVIEWRSAKGDQNRLGQLAADLVQDKVDVIVVESTPAAQTAKRAMSTIPNVPTAVANPVAAGLVQGLAQR